MKNGGKRTGAGRPKGSKASHTIEAQAIKAFLIHRAVEEMEPIINGLLRRARNSDAAAKDVLDRVLGKATDKVEVSGENGMPFQIVIKQKEQPLGNAGDTAI